MSLFLSWFHWLERKKKTNFSCILASWFDHARDLLHLTNVFRAQMPRPLIGLGHSFGGCIVVNVALMHPRLFSGLVMVDPVLSVKIRYGPLYGFGTMRASSSRRDLWPSRAEAARAVHKNKFYGSWDPRARDAMVRHGFRACPTALYPDKTGGEVTLTTTRHQEVLTYYRPRALGPRDPATGKRTLDRRLIPDASDEVDEYPHFPFYQPGPPLTARRLPELRPGVLWLAGRDSTVCPPETMDEFMQATGVGWGGSGGAAVGRVRQVVVEGAGHLVAMEKPGVVASHAAAFIQGEVARWRDEEDVYRREWVEGTDDRAKSVVSPEFKALIDSVGPEANRKRDGSMVVAKL